MKTFEIPFVAFLLSSAVALLLIGAAFAAEPEQKQVSDRNGQAPIVLSATELDGVTAGTDRFLYSFWPHNQTTDDDSTTNYYNPYITVDYVDGL